MSPILRTFKLGQPPWPTTDPFLFCVHHNDEYPSADEKLHPKSSMTGRNIGSDFSGKDGWSMYHGTGVPGFPSHPHRGFETVTLARKGYIDHSDSLGAKARFGHGDVQWMTAGSGVVHSEMFPLLNQQGPNHTELFQIWLNLPRKSKMVSPHFRMFWSEQIPQFIEEDEQNNNVQLTLIAGAFPPYISPEPPPNSWASQVDSHVAIWTIELDSNATWSIPATVPGLNRILYFFKGHSALFGGHKILKGHGIQLHSDQNVKIQNGDTPSELLVLQGRPIGEPVAKYGPFVMNTEQEIRQAMHDYQQTQFGGWPWERRDPVHGKDPKRFAVHVDGRTEYADG